MPIRHAGKEGKECDDIVTTQLPAHNHRTLRVHAVHLKDVRRHLDRLCTP